MRRVLAAKMDGNHIIADSAERDQLCGAPSVLKILQNSFSPKHCCITAVTTSFYLPRVKMIYEEYFRKTDKEWQRKLVTWIGVGTSNGIVTPANNNF